MATNRIIQRLNAGEDTSSNKRQVETFLVENPSGSGAPLTIAKGSVLAFDFSVTADSDKFLYLTAADTGTATSKCAVGVAAADYTIAEGSTGKVEVVIAGSAEVLVATGTAAGDTLVAGATAGVASKYANTDVLPVFAQLIAANSSGSPALRLANIYPQF